jgi:imidazole glycerol-phosphate synthase subunit HisH
VIVIVDYGLGNVLAFANVYKKLNIQARVARCAADLAGATRVILPGVGAFDHALERLDQSGMRGVLTDLVSGQGVPVLGICVGMQILANSSEEGQMQGLGWVPGRVRRLDATTLSQKTHLPHMGWNDVRPVRPSGLFSGLESDARFYFLHSYCFVCERGEDVLATTDYGASFSSAVSVGNVYGVQFHPEKSHHFGTRLLQNFAGV